MRTVPLPDRPATIKPFKVRLQKYLKWAMVLVLLALLAISAWLVFTTENGLQLRKDPTQLGTVAAAIVHHHPLTAPLFYIGLYLLLANLGFLPVWWLQILAGAGFGLWFGCLWSLIGATLGAASTVALSRWLAADWFHQRIESHMEKLRKLDNTLGHNGFLVVMTVRLIHILPFGLINYAMGITTVSMLDVLLGSFLGSIPAVAFYIGIGAGFHPQTNWKFDAILAGINLLMLLPLLLRYLRPQWFRKIGVE